MFAPLIAIALSIWGFVLPFTIASGTVAAQPAFLGSAYTLAYSQMTIYPGQPHPVACHITFITPHIAALTPHQLQDLVTHEVGHCGGLEHLDGHPGIMSPTLGYEFSDWDRLEYWRHWPAPYRLTVPGVSFSR